MGNDHAPAKIGHLVRFKGFTELDPPRDASGAWSVIDTGLKSNNVDGYILKQVERDPPTYTEHQDFVYIAKDEVASKIIVFLTDNKLSLDSKILERTWRIQLANKKELIAYGLYFTKEPITSITIFDFKNPDFKLSNIHKTSIVAIVKFKTQKTANGARAIIESVIAASHTANETVYLGYLRMIETGHQCKVAFKTYFMQNFWTRLQNHNEVAGGSHHTTGRLHPNGSGCSNGRHHGHCGECGKFMKPNQ